MARNKRKTKGAIPKLAHVPPTGAKEETLQARPPKKPASLPVKEKKKDVKNTQTVAKIFRGQTPKPLDGFMPTTTAINEVLVRYTRYFDTSASEYGLFAVDLMGSPLYQQGIASNELLPGRVLKTRMYALPLFDVVTSGSTVVVATSVPGLVGATVTGYVTLNQRTTVLTPKADSSWVFVGGWDDKKIYGEGDYRPAATADEAATGYNQNIMSYAVLDADTLELSDMKVQMKIDFSIAWPMPLVTHLRHAVVPSTSATWATNTTTDLPLNAVLAEVSGIVNRS